MYYFDSRIETYIFYCFRSPYYIFYKYKPNLLVTSIAEFKSFVLKYYNRFESVFFFITVDSEKGHNIHKPIKKKKPLGKHKKKKNSFKNKFLPLLLIPFVIQTMLIPFFIMKLKLLALKAMAVGKFAILLIIFNMMRNWSQNAHSTSIRGSTGVIINSVWHLITFDTTPYRPY